MLRLSALTFALPFHVSHDPAPSSSCFADSLNGFAASLDVAAEPDEGSLVARFTWSFSGRAHAFVKNWSTSAGGQHRLVPLCSGGLGLPLLPILQPR